MRRAPPRATQGPFLTIVADDYGYAPGYDAGIIEAVRAQAIDGVGAMVLREPEPQPLLAASAKSGVRVGLHLETFDEAPLHEQLAEFGHIFNTLPAFLDGHHHCHADAAAAEAVATLAERLQIPVRSVDRAHRRFLRARGVRTADRLVGRLSEDEPVLPSEVAGWLGGEDERNLESPPLTEWMVHPGHPDASSGSSYDAGRAEDLATLLELGDRAAWKRFGVTRVAPATSSIDASRS